MNAISPQFSNILSSCLSIKYLNDFLTIFTQQVNIGMITNKQFWI